MFCNSCLVCNLNYYIFVVLDVLTLLFSILISTTGMIHLNKGKGLINNNGIKFILWLGTNVPARRLYSKLLYCWYLDHCFLCAVFNAVDLWTEGRQIIRLLLNPMAYCRFSKNQPLDTVLSRLNPVHIFLYIFSLKYVTLLHFCFRLNLRNLIFASRLLTERLLEFLCMCVCYLERSFYSVKQK